MASFPRYTTYGVGELEQRLRDMDRGSRFPESLPSPAGSLPKGAPTQERSATGLLTRHSCQVTYPDGASGDCVYVRCGPTWHLFRYGHMGKDGKTSTLPERTDNARIANTVQAIEEMAKHKAADAFWSAVLRERKEYFQRASASEGMGRKAKPERSQMKAGRAKELSGKYALCRIVGKSRIPVSEYFDDMKEAVSAWEGQTDKTLVIACCNRLDRCWEEPAFNPLFANPDYPKPPFTPLPLAPIVLPPTREDLADAGEWDKAAEPDEDWDRGLEDTDWSEEIEEDFEEPTEEEEIEP